MVGLFFLEKNLGIAKVKTIEKFSVTRFVVVSPVHTPF